MLRATLFGFVVLFALLGSSIARQWFAQQSGAAGPVDRISFPKFFAVIPILIGLFFVVGSLHGFLKDLQPQWFIIAIFGAALIVPFLSLLFRSEIRLTDGVLTGPAGPWPRVLFERQAIEISDIAAVGVTKSGYTYYESNDGRRVYVSNGYPGSEAFNERVNSARRAIS